MCGYSLSENRDLAPPATESGNHGIIAEKWKNSSQKRPSFAATDQIRD